MAQQVLSNYPGNANPLSWFRRAASFLGIIGNPGPTAPKPFEMSPKEAYGHSSDQEKVASGPRGITLPWFLPFFDDVTEETATMRRQYRIMMRDPVVKAAVLGKLFGVAALDIKITPVSDDPGDVEVADFVSWNLTERIKGMVPKMVESIVLHALIDGVSICEKVWGVEEYGRWGGKHVLRMLKPKDIDNDIVMKTDEFRNVTSLMGIRYNGGLEFDPRDYVIFTHLPLFESPAGISDLRAAYGRFWVMDSAWKLRTSGLNSRSWPILAGYYQTIDQKPGLEASLNKARMQSFLTAPEGVRIEALEIAGGSQDEFKNAISDLREEIFLGIQLAMLQALTGGQSVQRGSSAAHKDTSDLAKWYLAQIFCASLNDHESGLIRDMVVRNFAGRRPPKASMSGVDDLELAESLAIDKGLAELGWDHSIKELQERYGRAQPMEDDDRMSFLKKKFGTQLATDGQSGSGRTSGLDLPEPPKFDDEEEFTTDWGYSSELMGRAG